MKPMAYLGGISYGIYLWHFAMVRQSDLWVSNGMLPDLFIVRFIAVFAATVAIAAASFYIVEEPLIAWSHRVGRQRPASAPRLARDEIT
jgi:peptidoglycan/LPS O-acetylase OafA/YrhL